MLTRKPRKGDLIRWPKQSPGMIWTVTEVRDDGIAWLHLPNGPITQHSKTTSFIWQFKEGLNQLAEIVSEVQP